MYFIFFPPNARLLGSRHGNLNRMVTIPSLSPKHKTVIGGFTPLQGSTQSPGGPSLKIHSQTGELSSPDDVWRPPHTTFKTHLKNNDQSLIT